MNKKRIIILAILFVAIAGFVLAPVSAVNKTYKTGKLYFKVEKKNKITSFDKKINGKNRISGFYIYPKNTQTQMNPNTLFVEIYKKGSNSPDYKITKTIIKFKKTVKGKTYYSTKTFKGNGVIYEPKNNYKPYYALVYYKKGKGTPLFS